MTNKVNHINLPFIVGKSKAIRDIHEIIKKVSETDSTVLILGESGTGKELIAKSIHYHSKRRDYPFIHVNCAAIPSALLESELFGYEKGAFTGAFNSRVGRFELADKGTIFLDEIGEMDPSLQVKILRVLQEKVFERIGGVKTLSVDVRIISATNKNLEIAVSEGSFRQDLYYRLNVIPIFVPPLRERLEDIPELCEYFIQKYSKKFGKEPLRLGESIMEYLRRYQWHGNVRELENFIERLYVLKEDVVVTINDLPEKIRQGGLPIMPNLLDDDTNPFINGIDLNKELENYEKMLILHALELHNGVKAKAARYLNINRTTLIEKLKRFSIDVSPSENQQI
ncbi:MAG: sigma-54 dependent transcriptional regulator [Thermodesulfovibrionales bacterium]|nr:sigma-54 dependent transcriptional regulator [Thermodesulfovibrionales bacterium]